MNVNLTLTKDYRKIDCLAAQKTNPIQTQSNLVLSAVEWANLQKAKINVNLTITKDYRKKDDFIVRINKPNFRNGQNQRKLNFNKGLQKKRLFRSPKNKPNSNPILSAVGGFQNELKIACRKIWPLPLLLLVRFEVAIMGILQ